MNDPIGDLVRAAKPGTVRRTSPLSSKAVGELAEYRAAEQALGNTTVGQVRALRRRNPWSWGIGSMVAAAVALLIVVTVVNLPRPAFAATPPMLDAVPMTESSSSLLNEMAAMRTGSTKLPTTLTTHSWALNSEIGDDGQIIESNTEPERIQTVFALDGSVHVTIVAAEPFPGQKHEGLVAPGTLLAEDVYAPGEYGLSVDDGPPNTSAEVGQYLIDFSGNSSLTASQTIREIGNVATSLPLSPGQEAALLEHLASVDGITVVGEVTDRLGRHGIAFSGDDGDYRQMLIVSPDNGALLAIETVYTGQDRSDITSPAVVYYGAWENQH